jgi:hypothetical protein
VFSHLLATRPAGQLEQNLHRHPLLAVALEFAVASSEDSKTVLAVALR